MNPARLTHVLKLVTGRAGDTEISFKLGLDGIESGTGRLVSPGTGAFDGDGIAFRPGDLLFGKLRPYLAKTWLADREGAAVGDFLVLRPNDSAGSRYLRYLLLSSLFLDPIAASVTGAKMPRTDWDTVKNSVVPVSNSTAQRAIADFLDRETAQIDEMIAVQQGLVDRLEERSRAMSAHEAHARVNYGQRLKWSLKESDARAGDVADELPLLSVSIDWGVRRRDATINQSASEDLTNYKMVRRGDVVVNRMRAFQGALGRSPEAGIVSPDYSVFRCSPSVDSEWLVAIMRSRPFVSEMAHRIRGIGSPDAGQVRTPRINANDLLDIRVEIPDLDTQRAEVASWRSRAEEMSRLTEATCGSITLMQERRAALISAAVAARIDPRTGREMVLESV